MFHDLDGPLILVGAGKMGGAMLEGWLGQGLLPTNVLVQDPSPPPEVAAMLVRYGIQPRPTLPLSTKPAAVVILAVKPQIMDTVLPTVARCVGAKTLVLSIAAGRTVDGLARHLPANTAIVRSIPNTPAAIGRGITTCYANLYVDAGSRARADQLLSTVGEVGWVEDETLIDAATAVAGSGPAYVFLLAEALTQAGIASGLPPDLAARLAQATVSGSGELMRLSEIDPSQLRKNVTSPNGTTAAALAILMAPGTGLPDLMTKAVAAATARSRALAG